MSSFVTWLQILMLSDMWLGLRLRLLAYLAASTYAEALIAFVMHDDPTTMKSLTTSTKPVDAPINAATNR